MLSVPLGIALVVVGSFLDVPAMAVFGIVLLAIEAVRQPWARRGLVGVEYARHMARRRAVVGDAIPIDIEVWNRKALPLAWIRADDEAGPGVVIRERELAEPEGGEGQAGATFRNAWTLAPYERVVRHYHVVAERRGTYRLGPASIEVGDLFARSAAAREVPSVDRWLVRPRSVPVRADDRERHWGGDLSARRGLTDDPTRYAGIRTYQPGDPLRVVHWKAVARLGYPVS